MSFAFGSAKRLPGAPAATIIAAADMPIPKQIVETSGANVLHRVVDGQPGVDLAARRVDVERDVLVGVLRLQEEELADDEVRQLVVDRPPEEHDPVAEQPG